MDKKQIDTDKAPKAIGPYSQAAQVGNMVFTSGQIALNPINGEMVVGDIAMEAQQVMENLTAVLTAADCTWSNVVKTTIYLTDMSYFSVVNEIYQGYLTAPFPARSTVAVNALPKKARVEIEAMAVK